MDQTGMPKAGLRTPGPPLGFTLVELIIICVVLAILLAATAPRFQPAVQGFRTEQTAFAVAQWVRLARERAVAESRECTWLWDEEARRMRIQCADAAGAGELDGGQATADRSPALPSEISLRITQDGQAVVCRCVRFFPDGTGDAATLEVSSPVRAFVVSVDDTTGHVVVAPGPAAP